MSFLFEFLRNILNFVFYWIPFAQQIFKIIGEMFYAFSSVIPSAYQIWKYTWLKKLMRPIAYTFIVVAVIFGLGAGGYTLYGVLNGDVVRDLWSKRTILAHIITVRPHVPQWLQNIIDRYHHLLQEDTVTQYAKAEKKAVAQTPPTMTTQTPVLKQSMHDAKENAMKEPQGHQKNAPLSSGHKDKSHLAPSLPAKNALMRDENDLFQKKEHERIHRTLAQKPLFIVTGLGLDRALTEQAIDDLPPSIALSFSSYAVTVNRWIIPATAAGHAVLLEMNSEDDLKGLNVLNYFQGVLLLAHAAPQMSPQKLASFAYTLKQAKKVVIDGRLMHINALENAMHDQGEKAWRVRYVVDSYAIFAKKLDLHHMHGIVLLPAMLVPYLIELFENPDTANIDLCTFQELFPFTGRKPASH